MVEISDLRKQFQTESGPVEAIKGISFRVPEGGLLTLLGPSGCGKSTTLRCLAGLDQPEAGTIKIDDQVVFSREARRFEPPERRPVGMVFQSYAIWPHMTVFDNVAYPLRGRGIRKAQIDQNVNRVLSLAGLAGLVDRPAPQLSGGQQQRVAVARALVANPKVLLLDEPLSNLDAKLRQHMRVEIRHLQKQSGVTAVYVTHDQEEAMAVSDEILFMSDGVIVEGGQPEEIYRRPRKKLTAEFFGDANFVKGRVRGKDQDYLMVETSLGMLRCSGSERLAGEETCVFFRPEDVDVTRERVEGHSLLSGTITQVTFLGKFVECLVQVCNDEKLKVSVDPKFHPREKEQVYLVIEPDACSTVTD
jgi:iron(III) transport system ATP-binding protein